MRKQDFEKLTESIRQAGRIRQGEEPASRLVEIASVDVKAMKQRLGKSQWQSVRAGDRGNGH